MRRIVIAASITLVAATLGLAAGTTPEDEAAIRATALDYLEGWYAGDAARMERALHPDLAKRIVRPDKERDRDRVDHMGALQLIQYTRAAYGARTPKDEQQKDVMILDVYSNTASVKTVARDFIDYLHLGKVDGEWKIINVLWEMKPKREKGE